jgi:hypothetical protein
MPQDVDERIDELYERPLEEFTATRAALVKDFTGEARRKIKAASKPSVPAWAVNQVYWRARPIYDVLVKTAEQLRTAHRAVIGGQTVDLRKPTEAHRVALEKARNVAAAILKKTNLPASAATLTAIAQTLDALPTTDRPGRLTRPLTPSGFEILSGVKPRGDLRLVSQKTRRQPHAQQESNSRVTIQGRADRTRLTQTQADLRQAEIAARKAVTALKTAESAVERAKADETRQRHILDRATHARATRERELADRRASAETTANRVREVMTRLLALKSPAKGVAG